MRITGLLLFILVFMSACNKITVRFNSPKTLISSLYQAYSVETAADGSGVEVDNITLEVGTNYHLYAIKRTQTGEFVNNLAVSWSKNGSSGNLSIYGAGESSEFVPITPGISQVAINVNGVQVRVVTITVIPATNPPLHVSNLVISNITTTSFDASIDFTGGSLTQGHTLYYCNATAAPACVPTAGLSQVMTVSGGSFVTSVTGLTNPGNVYKLSVVSMDSVTVTGSPTNTSITLHYLNLAVSNLVISDLTTTGFTATIDFTGGSPSQTHTLYYCNATVSAGCNPTTGTSALMTAGAAGTYTKAITGLTSPGDVFNVRVVSTDSVTVTGSPMNTTATLLYENLSVSGLAISSITSSSFRATIDYTGGTPTQSHTVYYCNSTISPGCDPGMGLFSLMIKSGTTYYANLTSLTSPTNTFNVRVVSTDSVTVTGSPQNTTTTLLGTGLSISNLVASNKTKTGMTMTISFTGDTENNSTVNLYYCNATDAPACNPAAGTQLAMTRSGSTYTVTVTGLTTPNDEADNLSFRVIATDLEGVTGSPLNTSFRLADFYIGNLVALNINTNSFTVRASFTEDLNATGIMNIYYCNQTDSPGCDPLSGTMVAMTRSTTFYAATITGLTSPNDAGDLINLRVVGSDTDGAFYTGTATMTLRLVDIEVLSYDIIDISDTRFLASLYIGNLDNNNNTAATLYYCDATATPACDPESSGVSATMTYGQYPDKYEYYVNNHGIPKGHTVNVTIKLTDPDQVYSGGVLATTFTYTTTIIIPNPTDIYRSVGPGQTTALHNGTASANDLVISGTTATFSIALANQIGVGDALFYDADNDTSIDSVAFIHGRTNNQTYTVKTVNGDVPVSATSHRKWKLYRSYISGANAENGIENSGITGDTDIPAGLRNFDSWSGGKDISAQTGSDQNWFVALYAGVQADNAKIWMHLASWPKDRSHIIKFYTPYLPSEVGVSQRHNGVWDNTKYRLVVNNDSAVDVNPTRTIIEGLQIQLTGTSNSVNAINSFRNSEGRIVGNLIRSTSSGNTLTGINIYNHGVRGDRWQWIYNNVVYNFNTTSSQGIWAENTDQEGRGGRMYNNTLFNNTVGIRVATYNAHQVVNNIILGSIVSDFMGTGSVIQKLYHNLVGDNTYSTIGVNNPAERFGNITGYAPGVVFMDHAAEDFRLAPGSPAIGTGYNASTVLTTDMLGNPRGPTFDIGAFQH